MSKNSHTFRKNSKSIVMCTSFAQKLLPWFLCMFLGPWQREGLGDHASPFPQFLPQRLWLLLLHRKSKKNGKYFASFRRSDFVSKPRKYVFRQRTLEAHIFGARLCALTPPPFHPFPPIILPQISKTCYGFLMVQTMQTPTGTLIEIKENNKNYHDQKTKISNAFQKLRHI